jgi:hypothetical protein
MDDETRAELAAVLRQAVKEHQQEGLHMIGGADQLVDRLVTAVQDWLEESRRTRQKTA